MRRVLQVAIERGAGSEEFFDRLPRGYLMPRREKGGRCPLCKAALATHKSGGRTGWFCPAASRRWARERLSQCPTDHKSRGLARAALVGCAALPWVTSARPRLLNHLFLNTEELPARSTMHPYKGR